MIIIDAQGINDICNTIITAINGYYHYNAVLETANKAFYASICSMAVTIFGLIINAYYTKKQIARDTTKTYAQLIVNEKFKSLNELRESMANIIGLSYDLLRRAPIIAKTDGSPRWEEHKKYIQLSTVDFNKEIAIIKLRIDCKKYTSFFKELDKFQHEVISSSSRILEDEETISKASIKSFEEKCRETLDAEWKEIDALSKKPYIGSKQ
ncbi:hypothetical protein [Pectinatus frisingensis]|uniref:hypothetical protein n=1 Tax=Pectinatus frisingensis TaxID=865 RepID=UPI0018C4A92F|nr:hypothetical protein [Pectinatus frisingensis]